MLKQMHLVLYKRVKIGKERVKLRTNEWVYMILEGRLGPCVGISIWVLSVYIRISDSRSNYIKKRPRMCFSRDKHQPKDLKLTRIKVKP
jgi:hypothetical protein